ncbi:MAG TPA: DUF4376 domain-containing protein [Azospirillaceae bacterium]|nr:DUF4376 domain-containing protein [Azospirillaceae bacterium]
MTATPLVVPLSLTQVKAAARAAAAAARYELEVGGVTVGGLRISTDRDSQMLISAAAAAARAGAMPAQIPLKHLDGIELIDAAAMIAIGDAVVAHVQAARRREYDVWVLIEAATDVQGVLAAASGDAGRQTPNP